MIELDMPNRTTRDYEGPAVAPRVQAALDAALHDEEDLTLDAEYVPENDIQSYCLDIFSGLSSIYNALRDLSGGDCEWNNRSIMTLP